MSRHKYLKRIAAESPLPTPNDSYATERPVAVYYRQSDISQVGNTSTSMQIEGMPEYLNRLGWSQERIIVIDDDAGISGKTPIHERPGMARLYDMIVAGEIGTVASLHEDRLFRDMTQIQVNVFIHACLEAGVKVLTPQTMYNFAGPDGLLDARQFRYQAELAADYLQTVVSERLMAGRQRRASQGIWVGGSIPIGFILDNRRKLSDGSPNPNWHRFVPFEPYAEVIREYFQIAIKYKGGVSQALAFITENGPYYPAFDDPEVLDLVPPGHLLLKPNGLKRHGNRYLLTIGSLYRLLTNIVYLGHWVFRRQLIRRHNHPAIVSEEAFMTIFNHLSSVTFEGKPNPDYLPPTKEPRQDKQESRENPPALCKGLLKGTYIGKSYKVEAGSRQHPFRVCYVMRRRGPERGTLWSWKVDVIDKAITECFFSKLKMTFAEPHWDETLAVTMNSLQRSRTDLLSCIEETEANLTRLNKGLDGDIAAEFSTSLERIRHLQTAKLDRMKSEVSRISAGNMQEYLDQFRDHILERVKHWPSLDIQVHQKTLRTFVRSIQGNPSNKELTLNLSWHDESEDVLLFSIQGETYYRWLKDDINRLKSLIEVNASADEIATAFPDRGWSAILGKIRKLAAQNTYVDPNWLSEMKSNHREAIRNNERTSIARAKRGTRWKSDELEQIRFFAKNGASQIEVARAFPNRTWLAIQRRFRSMGYNPAVITNANLVDQYETYSDYCMRLGILEKSQGVAQDNQSFSAIPSRRYRSEGSTKGTPFDLAKMLINHKLPF